MKLSLLRRLLLLFSLCVAMGTVRAQYVAIPDTNFATFLYTRGYGVIGDNINGWQLNTQDSAIVNERVIDCAFVGIQDLTGIEYFTSLTALFTMGNQLNSLPTLALSIRTLNCSSNQLTSLPALPPQLVEFNCADNQLSYLPAIPATVTYLVFSQNQISTIPILPPTLQHLECGYNPISSLPVLPASLNYLACDASNLSSLPSLPIYLETLTCNHNHLSVIPTLGNSLINLDCSYNPSLYCLPRIYPNNLSTFFIAGTQIACLPNRFTAYSYSSNSLNPASMPLCDPASGCDFYYNIFGTIHQDTSVTCLTDSLFPGAELKNIKVQLRQGGNVIQQFYTFTSGGYSFLTPSLGGYTVTIDTSSTSIYTSCPQSGIRSVVLSPGDSVKKHEGFGMRCAGADIGVTAIASGTIHPFRSSTITSLTIYAGDVSRITHNISCLGATSGTITVSYNGPVQYTGPSSQALTPSSISGHTLTYVISRLDSISPGDLNLLFSTDSNAIPGTPVCITAIVTPSIPDHNLSNDTLTACFEVRDSHDPNLKEVYPTSLTQNADWLTYTIHFQNTGNDTAYLVVLKDTLSQYVDAASFQYLASSHHAVIQLDHNAMTFTFPHINLVDSATNPPLSEGWIQYRVKANTNLTNGTAINNTAYIYFDNNPAVVTNTATTNVTLTTCSDTTVNIAQAICAGDTFRFYGQSLTAQGSYTDTIARAGGCDSIISLTLTVHAIPFTFIHDTICSGDTLRFLSDVFTHTDTAIYTWQNVRGCDSNVVLFVAVRPGPVVTFTWDSLLYYGEVTIYRNDTAWCSNMPRSLPLLGGLPQGGSYSGQFVQSDVLHLSPFVASHLPLDTITYTYTDSHGCTASASNILHINICVGINEIENLSDIKLYPNPNTGTFTLTTSNSHKLDYTITNMLGDVIEQKTITADTQTIDMGYAAAGVYTLYVKGARPVRFTVVR